MTSASIRTFRAHLATYIRILSIHTSSATMTDKEVPLRNKSGNIVAYALVSYHDYDKVMQRKWNMQCVQQSKKGLCYTLSTQNNESVRMHQYIMGAAPEGMVIDHINNNGLDNRRDNLRFVTFSQNTQNTQKREGTTSRYKGVSYNKKLKRWRMQYGKNEYYKFFDKEEAAARCYDKYVLIKFGEHARTNGLVAWHDVKDLNLQTEFLKEQPRKLPRGITYRTSTQSYRVEIMYNKKKYTSCYYKTLDEAIKELEVIQGKINNIKIQANKLHQESVIVRTKDGIAFVPATNSDILVKVLVDDEHWHDLSRFTWCINNHGYVITTMKKKNVLMHAFVMKELHGVQLQAEEIIDHINNIRHDNRFVNLRVNTRSGNSHNKKKKEGSASRYFGVYKNGNGWSARIKKACANYNLGTFKAEHEAAKAYNLKAYELYGDAANLNVLN